MMAPPFASGAMSSVLALSIALLAQLPLPNRAELKGNRPMVLEADTLVYEPSQELLVATGHAVLRTDQLVVRADELTYDQAHDKATARGNVTFVSGPVAAVADSAAVDLATMETTVEHGLFMTKKGVSPEALADAS
jgi:LPS-assembly protein